VVLPALCSFGKSLQAIDPTCTLVSTGTLNSGCRHTRTYVRLAQVPFPGLWLPVIHHNCVGNQVVAVVNRVIGMIPSPDPIFIRNMRATADLVAARMPKVLPQELGHFALDYTGAKRRRYLQAVDDVNYYGLRKQDYNITMFIKPDRIDPTSKRNPDPRPIQFRKATYCVVLAKYIKAIEPHLYCLKFQSESTSNIRMVAKGLNQYQRARILQRKWNLFSSPEAATIDGERFDKHMNAELLKVEHHFYTRILNHPEFKRLLKVQLQNTGYTAEQIKYLTSGRRMSGEMNTALGNCVIMILMALTVLLPTRLRFELFDDGDDCLVIYNSHDAPRIHAALRSMSSFGLNVKVENIANTFEHITFCQSRPIYTAKGYKFCRNPVKVLSTALVGQKWSHLNAKGRATYLNGLAECECILNKGVPMLHEFAMALRRNAHSNKTAFNYSSGEYLRYVRELKAYKNVNEHVPITHEARLSFASAFDITIAEQLFYEQSFRDWRFPLDGDVHEHSYMDPITWLDNRVYHLHCAARRV
jgi:hypothetical protein